MFLSKDSYLTLYYSYIEGVEHPFLVTFEWFAKNWRNAPKASMLEVNEFLDWYEPSVEGVWLFEKAKLDGALVDIKK